MNTSTALCRRCVLHLSRRQHHSLKSKRWITSAHSPPHPSQSLPTKDRKPSNRHAYTQQAFDSALPSYDPIADVYTTSLGHETTDTKRRLLLPDNLFHSFSHSPIPEIRRRAAIMRSQAYCPHPSHHRTRYASGPFDPENRKPLPGDHTETGAPPLPPKHVSYECPDCGVPVSCCEEHFLEDFEAHLEVCEILRQANEDDHDLRSGRFNPEFLYPGPQRDETFLLNMSDWDTLLYTRDFKAVNDERAMRQLTRLMTYPMTIATVLHELSPYGLNHDVRRLTPEGFRSLGALRYSLHPPLTGTDGSIKTLRPSAPPIRIFILGARAESSIPRSAWLQITHCFPRSKFHIIFVGPESMSNRDDEFPLPERTSANPYGAVVEAQLGGRLKISTYVEYWHNLYRTGEFGVLDPYFDVFMAYHPGFGHPASSHEWEDSLQSLLDTKCTVVATGYTEWDMERDRQWVVEKTNGGPNALNRGFLGGPEAEAMMEKDAGFRLAVEKQREKGEMEVLIEPGENIFRSLRWDINDFDPTDVSCGNWGVWAFRGRRYEAVHQGE